MPFFLIALAAAAATTPAGALPSSKASSEASPVAAPTANGRGRAATPSAATRYCIVEATTGSRLPQRECRTRKDWLLDGYDPLAKR